MIPSACVYIYRVIWVKLANFNKLSQTENMDRFLIKWYFDYCKGKGGEFYMVPQKFRKKNLPGTQNLCQIHNIQYIKLKENSKNLSMFSVVSNNHLQFSNVT